MYQVTASKHRHDPTSVETADHCPLCSEITVPRGPLLQQARLGSARGNRVCVTLEKGWIGLNQRVQLEISMLRVNTCTWAWGSVHRIPRWRLPSGTLNPKGIGTLNLKETVTIKFKWKVVVEPALKTKFASQREFVHSSRYIDDLRTRG